MDGRPGHLAPSHPTRVAAVAARPATAAWCTWRRGALALAVGAALLAPTSPTAVGGAAARTGGALRATTAPQAAHPRLWLRAADLPRLRAWATPSNPLYHDGLAVVAAQARSDMDKGLVPAGDKGGTAYEEYPSESYAELFAFMALISPDAAARADYARRARTLLMHVIAAAGKGPAGGQPFRDPAFATSDRSRWDGEGFALTVDWIYPVLSAADKAAIRAVFLRWADEDAHATTTTANHPEPLGVVNSPALLRDPVQVRWAANNYYTAHLRNLGLMALALDPQDDPGGRLHAYLREATGAWLYVVDYLLRHDARGGLAPEGFEYGPQSMGDVLQFLLALHTAGADDPAHYGPQVVLARNPFWAALVPGFLHQLSPVPTRLPGDNAYLGPVYQPASYGDAQNAWVEDYITAFGPLGLYAAATGNTAQLEAIRWLQLNTPPGGAAGLLERITGRSPFRDAILYFLLFDPHALAPRDPRPGLGLSFFAPGIGRLLARTGWDAQAAWFTYSLGWLNIDHQMADGNSFDFYRHGEWLTKARAGYGLVVSGTDYHNTLALENSPPAHNDAGDYRHVEWQSGSQWLYEPAGDGRIVATSVGRGYVYALGDATALYNSTYEGVRDITEASRSIVWLEPDWIVVYDRAASRTPGRFKRFWLQLPSLPTIAERQADMVTPQGQHLYITTLLPTNAALSAAATDDPQHQGAVDESMRYRLRVEAPGGPTSVRFLHVLQGADRGARAGQVSLLQCAGDATPFAGALVASTAVLFPVRLGVTVRNLSCALPGAARGVLISGLAPRTGYTASLASGRLALHAGGGLRADSGGVLTLRGRA